jgi:hypothetical protein
MVTYTLDNEGVCGADALIEKTVRRRNVRRFSEVRENLAFWLSRNTEERVAGLEHLRRTHIGSAARLQRTARVIRFLAILCG